MPLFPSVRIYPSNPPTKTLRPRAMMYASNFENPVLYPLMKLLDALEVLAGAFQRRLAAWEREGFAAVAAAWTERAHGLGERCEARLADRTLSGVAEGLDTDGALKLRLDDGRLERITAGDVFFGGA